MWTCDVRCLPVTISIQSRVAVAYLRLWNYNCSVHVCLSSHVFFTAVEIDNLLMISH